MFNPPYYALPMPVDAEGRGPVDEDVAVKTLWEVWNGDLVTIVTYEDRDLAEETANKLNNQELKESDV